MAEATFEQAAIPVQSPREFNLLRGAFDEIFGPSVEKFLKAVQSKGMRLREYDRVLASGVVEKVATGLGKERVKQLYEALPLSDRAQVREHYLLRLEQVDDALRVKYAKVYIDHL